MVLPLTEVAIGWGRAMGSQDWTHLHGVRCPRMGSIQPHRLIARSAVRVRHLALGPGLVRQVPGRHVARPLADPLEVLIRPVDLQLRGMGGVRRGACVSVEEHVVAGFWGVEISQGSGGCRGEGSPTGYPESSGGLARKLPGTFGWWGSLPMHQPPPPAPMQITIGRAKRGIGSLLPGQAYVGPPSVLGNPFVVGRDGSRNEVIAQYRRWLGARLQEPNSPQADELRRLLARAAAGELELLCWCHPLPCYAEVVRSALLWLAGEEGAVEEAGSVEGA